MVSRKTIAVVHVLVLAGGLGAAALAAQESRLPAGAPILISPGGRGQEGEVGTSCPTFSWAAVDGAAGYEVVVYESNGGAGAPVPEEPVLRIELPAGVSSWTPDLREGLAPGRYAWAVAARVRDGGPPRWSQPALFRVVVSPAPARETPPRRDEKAVLAPASLPASPATSWFEPPGLRSLTDEAYIPPVCGSAKFSDVAAGDEVCRWIEQLDRDGIMTSCDGGSSFCPDNPVTRKQLAMALGKTARGTATWHPAQGSNWLAPPLGNTVTTVDDAGDVGQHTSITIGVDGLPIISYYDATETALKVAHCHDVACAGQKTITTVDNSGSVGQYTSITIGADGLPLISYYDATIDLDLDIFRQALKVAHCNDVACSGQDETLTFVHDSDAGAVGLHTSIAIGADGLPIISYYDFGGGGLWVAHCNDAACETPATKTTVDPSNVADAATSIAIGGDGRGIISYVYAGHLKVAHCNSLECTAQTAVQVTANNVTGGPSITIGADGLPIIAFQVGARLDVAHCNDLLCSGGNETISSPNYGGVNNSITIGADGLPIISMEYGALVVIHCSDGLCLGPDGVGTYVDFPNVGQYNSITIGVDGLPISSYYDANVGALKVAHCASVSCVPYFRRR